MLKNGSKVSFYHKEKLIKGKVERINRKTYTIITSRGEKWRVSPNLLIEDSKKGSHSSQKNLSNVGIAPNQSENTPLTKNKSRFIPIKYLPTKFLYKKEWNHGIIVKINFKTCNLISENGMLWKVHKSFLKPTEKSIEEILPEKLKKFHWKKSGIIEGKILKRELEEVKKAILQITKSFFSPQENHKFNTVSIQWGNRTTFKNCGWYNFSQNLIQISKSFKNTPKYVIHQIIWHELLHIHFGHHESRPHPPEFKIYEKKYSRFHEAKEFKKIYLQYLQISDLL